MVINLGEINVTRLKEIFSHVGFLREDVNVGELHIWNKITDASMEDTGEGFNIKLSFNISDRAIVEDVYNKDFLFLLNKNADVNYIPLVGIYSKEITSDQIHLSFLTKEQIYKDRNKFMFMHFREFEVKIIKDDVNQLVSNASIDHIERFDYLKETSKEEKKKTQYYFVPKGLKELNGLKKI